MISASNDRTGNDRPRVNLSEIIAPCYYNVHNDILRKAHREYWFKGGRGSAKSSFISIEIILGMLKHPDANAIIFRKVAATLRESVYEQMIWAIGMLQLDGLFSCRVSPMEIRYKPTGQRILFRGADDPAKSKSIKLSKGYFGYLWFEELAEFRGTDELRTIIASAIRGGDFAQIFCSYNPPMSTENWVNDSAVKRDRGQIVHESCYLQIPKEWLGDDFIFEAETLRASNERAYRHMYLGEITGAGGTVFENVDIRAITPEELKSFGATYSGMDFGWFPDPLHFVRCAYSPAQQRLWIFDEYRTNKTANYDVFQNLQKYKGLQPWEEVIADSADPKSIADMRSYGMNCVAAMKGPGSVNAGIKWLQTLKEIVIDPGRCPETADEFRKYEYEKDRNGKWLQAYPDRDNHAIDAVRYAMNRVWMRAGA